MARTFNPNPGHLSHEQYATALFQGLFDLEAYLNYEFKRKSLEMIFSEYIYNGLERDVDLLNALHTIMDYIEGESFIRTTKDEARHHRTVVPIAQ